MVNTLYLPELREMLAEQNAAELQEFCTALHPARTADFMDGLTADESWGVLQHAELPRRVEIFSYFDHDKQVEIIGTQDRREIAELLSELAADDRVDLVTELPAQVLDELLPLLPADERREVLRLSAYPEGTAGAVMTTEVARFHENLTVREAFEELRHQAEELETISYLYVVDEAEHLRGVVSLRRLVSSMRRPDVKLGELMERAVVSVDVADDQEEVSRKVAKYDLMAIPVVDHEHHLLGIITHDDVIDVVREEATEDAHMSAAVNPLDESYLKTHILTLGWKRGIWLSILFVGAQLTVFALDHYQGSMEVWPWLLIFIPMIVSCGGNSGSQSATLIITAMAHGEVNLKDWRKVVFREVQTGLLLGFWLAFLGVIVAWIHAPDARTFPSILVMPTTVLFVILSSTLTGAMLPLLFRRMGLDPALMSNPFISGIIDVLGIVIYLNVALLFLPRPPT